MEAFLRKNVLAESTKNLMAMWQCGNLPDWARKSIGELVERRLVGEINDRFFKTLEFGTGGMRSRTIGDVVTSAERGNSKTSKPDFAAVGSAYLNDFNIVGATIALFRYCSKFLGGSGCFQEVPSVAIAYDTRHFSRHFCELAASAWVRLGGQAMIYESPRSTPQLSFTVRHLHCTAGIMITASHNPWHDNGFKAYFGDGAQMVDPHASGVIAEFNGVTMDEICRCCGKSLSNVATLGSEIDCHYRTAAANSLLRADILEKTPIRAAFSPLHGTGGIAAIPLMESHGVECAVVEEQNDCDPNFSTVKSPNPENGDAMAMAIALGKDVGADIALATDPDGDRLAIAARGVGGEFEIFSGNVSGALIAEYRISQLKILGKIPENGSRNAALIKTFVTTPLVDKIADFHGIKCINTLTGFKWIGAKMLNYETDALAKERALTGASVNYDAMETDARRSMLLKHSTLFIFGCEESYGCLAVDNIRDKDANGACLMACEMAAYAKSIGKTLLELRDDMYVKYGYFGESVLNIYFDGVNGAQKIENILASYGYNPPTEMCEHAVEKITDFSKEKITDGDGKIIPSQKFFFMTLANGVKFAVRSSGTEPKIKFYMFAEANVSGKPQLAAARERTAQTLRELEKFLREDAHNRSNFTA
ncbi:MAG: phospho-sugar mutase [Puniceicoccales bacterium]|jgi:phosphoglucomutase|nr:phospho-sugar mutase [Puniceicoccales bacterium]